MKKWFIFAGSIIICLIVFSVITLYLLSSSLKQTSGHFGYPLDDTYIHMAMARHFAERCSWGVSLYGFSSSTSSPLWTLLISFFFKIAGVKDLIPFILCLAIGSFAIIIIALFLRKHFSPIPLIATLLTIIIFSPMPVMTLTGLEHLLHSFLNFILLFLLADSLRATKISNQRSLLILLFSCLLTITRYEGVFLIVIASLLFLIYKRFSKAIFLALAGAFPILLYGAISTINGWYFLPNPVLLKGHISSFYQNPIVSSMSRFSENLTKCPQLPLMIVFILALYIISAYKSGLNKNLSYLTFIYLLPAVAHLIFADTGWFYRYEAYLIFSGLAIAAYLVKSCWPENLKSRKGIFILIALIFLGLINLSGLTIRALNAYKNYPLAVKNIYEQQYQMGLFLRQYYQGSVIAANDIGAINYLADIYMLDLVGLANKEVLKMRMKKAFDSNFLHSIILSKKTEIIIIYRSWFYPNIPSEWIEIGRWRIRDNVVCGSDEVSFFVALQTYKQKAITNLKAFSKQLPSSVRQFGLYLNRQE